jgi:negative regulator of sigma-B (phosphoserine phosphatase)
MGPVMEQPAAGRGAYPTTAIVEWAVAGRPYPGCDVSGDLETVLVFPQGTLLGLVDGLGHGAEAAEAARAAVESLASHAPAPLPSLMRCCHERLIRTRGAALSLAWFDGEAGTLTWLGVGNVAGFLVPADPASSCAAQEMPQRAAVIGMRLPPLEPKIYGLHADDTLVMATDGISYPFIKSLDVAPGPAAVAADILVRYAVAGDDATVLVARYQPHSS